MDTTYTSPVDKLLTVGKPKSTTPDSWPNYLELGLGSQHIPELIRNDYELNAINIGDLAGMNAVETLPLIERAFKADRVDEFVINLDYVLEEFGLKEREEIPDSFTFGNFFENLERRGSPINPDQIQIVSSGIPDTTPQLQKARPSTYAATSNVIKFSGERVTKKKGKKKR